MVNDKVGKLPACAIKIITISRQLVFISLSNYAGNLKRVAANNRMEMTMNTNVNGREFYDGVVSNHRQREWDREDRQRYNRALGHSFTDSNKKLLREEIGGADEEYLKVLQ
jgi:hypothetical protein